MSSWHLVAEEGEFKETDRKLVDLGGNHQIGLFKQPDGFYAISTWCTHQKTTMIHGEVCDGALECPLHGARFDLRTGRNLCLPAVRPVARYDVKVEDGRIYIKV